MKNYIFLPISCSLLFLSGCGEDPLTAGTGSKPYPIIETPKKVTLTQPFWKDSADPIDCELFAAQVLENDENYALTDPDNLTGNAESLYQIHIGPNDNHTTRFFLSMDDGSVVDLAPENDQILISRSVMDSTEKFKFFSVDYLSAGSYATISFSYDFFFSKDFPSVFNELVLSRLDKVISSGEYNYESNCYSHAFDADTSLIGTRHLPFYGEDGDTKHGLSHLSKFYTSQYASVPMGQILYKYSSEPFFMYKTESAFDFNFLFNPVSSLAFAFEGETAVPLARPVSSADIQLNLQALPLGDTSFKYGISYSDHYYTTNSATVENNRSTIKHLTFDQLITHTYSIESHWKQLGLESGIIINGVLTDSDIIDSDNLQHVDIEDLNGTNSFQPSFLNNQFTFSPDISSDTPHGYKRASFHYTSKNTENDAINGYHQVYTLIDEKINLPYGIGVMSRKGNSTIHSTVDLLLLDESSKDCISPEDFTQLFRSAELGNSVPTTKEDSITVASGIPSYYRSISNFHTCDNLLISISKEFN